MALDVPKLNPIGNSLTELYKFLEQNGRIFDIREKAEQIKNITMLEKNASAQVVPKLSIQDKEFMARQELARNFDIQSGLNIYNLI